MLEEAEKKANRNNLRILGSVICFEKMLGRSLSTKYSLNGDVPHKKNRKSHEKPSVHILLIQIYKSKPMVAPNSQLESENPSLLTAAT